MKQFVRGRCSRAISSLLVALFLLPCLTMSLCTPGRAESGGPQSIILLPLSTKVGNAPDNLGGLIFQELQLCLASHPGMQVMELTSTSPVYLRVKAQMTEDERAEFDDRYKKATDPNTEKEARQQAAGKLVKKLSVDSIVYGVIDKYEFSTDPDPRQTLIHLTATKVMCDETLKPVAFPLVAIGRSKTRLNDHNSQTMHDREAVTAIAHNIADLLTGTVVQAPPNHGDNPTKPVPEKKNNNTAWYALLGVVLVIVAVGAGHGGSSSGSQGTPSTPVAPSAPTNVLAAEATQQLMGASTIKLGYPQITWGPPTSAGSSAITGYQIWRDSTKSRVRDRDMRGLGKPKLLSSIGGAGTRSRTSRAEGMARASSRDAGLLGSVSASTYTYTDTAAQNGQSYLYYVIAVSNAGSSIASSEVSFGPANLLYPTNIPASAITATPDAATPTKVDLKWTAPSTNSDGSSITGNALPGTCLIYRSTTNNSSTVNFSPVTNSSTFTFVGTQSWTTPGQKSQLSGYRRAGQYRDQLCHPGRRRLWARVPGGELSGGAGHAVHVRDCPDRDHHHAVCAE